MLAREQPSRCTTRLIAFPLVHTHPSHGGLVKGAWGVAQHTKLFCTCNQLSKSTQEAIFDAVPLRRRPETCVRMPVCVCVCVCVCSPSSCPCVVRRSAAAGRGSHASLVNGPQSTRTEHRHCQWHQMCLAQGFGALAVNVAANELYLRFYEVGETSSTGTHLTVRVV